MLILIWLALCFVVSSFILVLLGLVLRDLYQRYSGSRTVICPDNGQPAVVSIDARHAALTGLDSHLDLRLSECTRWPECRTCDRACLPQAASEQTYAPVQERRATKQVYHLPVVLAAFMAWVLGALWHAQYAFRVRWEDAVGLTRAEVKQMVWWMWPHLLTAGMCLLFAYGVAGLLALAHRKGFLQGVLISLLLCGALIAASWPGLARLPHDLFVIELGYFVLAALTMGSIIGGMYDKLVLPPD